MASSSADIARVAVTISAVPAQNCSKPADVPVVVMVNVSASWASASDSTIELTIPEPTTEVASASCAKIIVVLVRSARRNNKLTRLIICVIKIGLLAVNVNVFRRIVHSRT